MRRKEANETEHSISFNIACAYSEDSDQLSHQRSLIRVFTGHAVVSQDPKCYQADSEDSDQTAQMPDHKVNEKNKYTFL